MSNTEFIPEDITVVAWFTVAVFLEYHVYTLYSFYGIIKERYRDYIYKKKITYHNFSRYWFLNGSVFSRHHSVLPDDLYSSTFVCSEWWVSNLSTIHRQSFAFLSCFRISTSFIDLLPIYHQKWISPSIM